MSLLAIDIGTTHCKAGLFSFDGNALKISSKPMVSHKASAGWTYFDPVETLEIVAAVVQDVTQDSGDQIASIGIASMAETGLLVDCRTGKPRSFLIPWFETISQPQADTILRNSEPLEIYKKFGLKINFKNSLTKLLWLRQSDAEIAHNAIWLSAADFVLFSMTGVWGTDYSLAGRTLAFNVNTKCWDEDWLQEWGFTSEVFPPTAPSGTPLGKTANSVFGLSNGIPVSVCGHDHVCAALAVGAVEPGVVFDSMGTAEAMVGALPQRSLTDDDFYNGLQYGCHVADGLGYWMGGLSTSGGSIEWLRSLPGKSSLPYNELIDVLNSASADPTGILYFPYLLGSGSPHTDPCVRAAFIGLGADHDGGDFFKAVLEGVAYEIECVRRAGESMIEQPIQTLIVAGGGTRYNSWLQIKADISGCQINVSAESEATLLGAALVAGIGQGVYHNVGDALTALDLQSKAEYLPDPERHKIYKNLFENGYLAFQNPLRNISIPLMD